MTNITSLLKSEISRLARKEVRSEIDSLKKAAAHYRTDISALKRALAAQEKLINRLRKTETSASNAASDENPKLRFRAAGFASLRKKLGLSAAEMGKLLDVSLQTIYHWEKGQAKPRASQLQGIAEVRKLGKRGAAARLAEA